MTLYGVQPTGFVRKPLSTTLAEIEASLVTVFGPNVIQTSQSPLGQINGLMADLITSLWETAEDVYQSYDPDQAEGLRLETLARLRLLERATGESDMDFRQAITNSGRARIDLQDLTRALLNLEGVTYVQVFVNDQDATDANGISGHSIAVAIVGGDDEAIATILRTYIVPGVGSYGNLKVDVNIEGFCRSIWIVRPVNVPVKVQITIDPQADNLGCPPPSPAAVKAGLLAELNGDRAPINGEDITTFLIRSIVESRYPNVEVTAVLASRTGVLGAPPVAISFFERASFALADLEVLV